MTRPNKSNLREELWGLIRRRFLIYLFLYVQFALIVLFVYGLSSEYRSNPYQQDWIWNNAPILAYVLNGYLAAMLVGVLIGGGVLLVSDYWRNRKKSSLRTVG